MTLLTLHSIFRSMAVQIGEQIVPTVCSRAPMLILYPTKPQSTKLAQPLLQKESLPSCKTMAPNVTPGSFKNEHAAISQMTSHISSSDILVLLLQW